MRSIALYQLPVFNDTGPGDVFLGKGRGHPAWTFNFTVGAAGRYSRSCALGVKAGSAKGAEGFMVKGRHVSGTGKGVCCTTTSLVTRALPYVGGHVEQPAAFLEVSQEGADK